MTELMTEWHGWLPDGGLLKDQVALVAGGAGGIGEAVSRILAAAGATVVIADASGDRAAAVSDSIGAAGGTAVALACDLRDEGACAAVLFFASPMAAQVTGQTLLVDGGISVTFPYRGLGEDR